MRLQIAKRLHGKDRNVRVATVTGNISKTFWRIIITLTADGYQETFPFSTLLAVGRARRFNGTELGITISKILGRFFVSGDVMKKHS